MIDEHWPDAEAPSELDLERRAHAAFAASRTRAYIPNPDYLREFAEWTGRVTNIRPSLAVGRFFVVGF